MMIKPKETINAFLTAGFCMACLACGQNAFADPLNDALSGYMECFQQDNVAAPEADVATHRDNCKQSFDVLNALFPAEIAMIIIEQAEIDALQQ
jgi:hypothetical protein